MTSTSRPASDPAGRDALVAEDPRMVEVVRLVERVAPTRSSVLISGESGTGKDVVAHALHFWSGRASSPLVKVDFPSLPTTLIESELFGHERGAFTGATSAKPGRFELAGDGTVLLDHIGELSPFLQAKLLRVVEDRRFERLGGTETLELQARIVATATADLEQAVERELFRRDLFHRLGVFWIRLPALRDRPADIEPLARAFLESECERRNRAPRTLAPETNDVLRRYAWPGNVRELKGAIEHAVLLSQGDVVKIDDLPAYVVESVGNAGATDSELTLAEVEKRHILRVLEAAGGNQTRAASILGISRKSLWERRRRYGIDSES